MQPTHVKWEQIHDTVDHDDDRLMNGIHTNGHHVNGGDAGLGATSNGFSDTKTSQAPPSLFKPVPDVVSRNYLVTDVCYESPPISNLGVPGPDGDVDDLGPNGLSTIDKDVLDELPEDCRRAFEEARGAELAWKNRWDTEQTHGSRGKLRIGFNGFPV